MADPFKTRGRVDLIQVETLEKRIEALEASTQALATRIVHALEQRLSIGSLSEARIEGMVDQIRDLQARDDRLDSDIENLVPTSHLATRLGHLFHPNITQDEDLFEDVAERLAASVATADELKRRILFETDNRPTRFQSLIHALTGLVTWRLW